MTFIIDVWVLLTQGLIIEKTSSSKEKFLSSKIMSATINNPQRQTIKRLIINKTDRDSFLKKEKLLLTVILKELLKF